MTYLIVRFFVQTFSQQSVQPSSERYKNVMLKCYIQNYFRMKRKNENVLSVL